MIWLFIPVFSKCYFGRKIFNGIHYQMALGSLDVVQSYTYVFWTSLAHFLDATWVCPISSLAEKSPNDCCKTLMGMDSKTFTIYNLHLQSLTKLNAQLHASVIPKLKPFCFILFRCFLLVYKTYLSQNALLLTKPIVFWKSLTGS